MQYWREAGLNRPAGVDLIPALLLASYSNFENKINITITLHYAGLFWLKVSENQTIPAESPTNKHKIRYFYWLTKKSKQSTPFDLVK
jgi:hypothetical protein